MPQHTMVWSLEEKYCRWCTRRKFSILTFFGRKTVAFYYQIIFMGHVKNLQLFIMLLDFFLAP